MAHVAPAGDAEAGVCGESITIDQYNYNCITFAFLKSNRWPQSWATGARKEGLGLDRVQYLAHRVRLSIVCLYYIKSWAIRIRQASPLYALRHLNWENPIDWIFIILTNKGRPLTQTPGWSQLYDQCNYYSSARCMNGEPDQHDTAPNDASGHDARTIRRYSTVSAVQRQKKE